MGKSIRSKRLKRLRTLKRDIAEPYYDAKDEAKEAIAAAALAAPKIELPRRNDGMDVDNDAATSRGRVATGAAASGPASMLVDGEPNQGSVSTKSLKAVGGVSKRDRSKKGHRTKKVIRSKRKKQVKF